MLQRRSKILCAATKTQHSQTNHIYIYIYIYIYIHTHTHTHTYACVHAKSLQLCPTLQVHGLQPNRLLCPQGFYRQEYQNGLPCPPPEDLSDPGIEPLSLMSPALVGGLLTSSTTWEAIYYICVYIHKYVISLIFVFLYLSQNLVAGMIVYRWDVCLTFSWRMQMKIN